MQRKDWWNLLKRRKRDEEGHDDYDRMDTPTEFGIPADESQRDAPKAESARPFSIADMANLDALEALGAHTESASHPFDGGEAYDDSGLANSMKQWVDNGMMREGEDLPGNIRDILLSVFLLGTSNIKGVDSLGRAYGGTDKFGRGRDTMALKDYLKLTTDLYAKDPDSGELVLRTNKRVAEAQDKLNEAVQQREADETTVPQRQIDMLTADLEQAQEYLNDRVERREKLLGDAENSLSNLTEQLGGRFSAAAMLSLMAKYWAEYVHNDDWLMEGLQGKEYFDAERWQTHNDDLIDQLKLVRSLGDEDAVARVRAQLDEHKDSKYKMSSEEFKKERQRKSRLFSSLQSIYADMWRDIFNPIMTWNKRQQGDRLIQRAHDVIESGNLPNFWSTDLDTIYGVESDKDRPHTYSSYNPELFNPQHYESGGPLSEESLYSETAADAIRELMGRYPSMQGCHATTDLLARLERGAESKNAQVKEWLEHIRHPTTLDNVMGTSQTYQRHLSGLSHGHICPECENGNHEHFLKDDASPFQPRLLNPRSDQQASKLAGAPFSQSEGAMRVIRAVNEKRETYRELVKKSEKLQREAEKLYAERDVEGAIAKRMEFDRVRKSLLSRDQLNALASEPPPEGTFTLKDSEGNEVPMDFFRMPSFESFEDEALEEAAKSGELATPSGYADIDPDTGLIRDILLGAKQKGKTRPSILRNAVGLERDINDMFMRVRDPEGEEVEPISSELWSVERDRGDRMPDTEGKERQLAKAHTHLGERAGQWGLDYTPQAAELQSTWSFIKERMNSLKGLREATSKGESPDTEGSFIHDWDDALKKWVMGKRTGEIDHYDIFARLKTLEEADSDNEKLSKLAKETGMKTNALKQSLREPLQFHREMAHLIHDLSTRTSMPPRAWKENQQRLGRDEDMPLGKFASSMEGMDPQREAGMEAPTRERVHSSQGQMPPLLRFVYEQKEDNRSKTVMQEQTVVKDGKKQTIQVPVAVPWSWQGGAIPGGDRKRTWTERPPEASIPMGRRTMAGDDVIDPKTGGRLLLNETLLRDYQTRNLRMGPKDRKTPEGKGDFPPVIFHPPHVRSGKKALGYNEDIEKAIEANVNMHVNTLSLRTHNNYGQPAAEQIGYVQPHEISPYWMVALQYGFPQHMMSDEDGVTFHGDAGWPIDAEGNPDYSRRDAFLKIFDFAMRGGSLSQYYSRVNPESGELERLPSMDVLREWKDTKGMPVIIPLLLSGIMNHIMGNNTKEAWENTYEAASDESPMPRGEDSAWRAQFPHKANLYDSLKKDLLDWVVNPEAHLRKLQAQMGVKIGEETISGDDYVPGTLTIQRNEQNTRNPTGGFERCRHCNKDGYINYDSLVTRGMAQGSIDPMASQEDKRKGVEKMLEDGHAKVWGDNDDWREQYIAEAPHLNRPAENVHITGVRFTCPDCDGTGLCGGHHPERNQGTELPDNLAHTYSAMLDKAHDYRTADAAMGASLMSPGPAYILGETMEEYFARNPELDPSLSDDSTSKYWMSSFFQSMGHGEHQSSFFGTGAMSFKEAIEAAIAGHSSHEADKIRSTSFEERGEKFGQRYRKPEPESEESREALEIQHQLQRINDKLGEFSERDYTHRAMKRRNAQGTVKTVKKVGQAPVWSKDPSNVGGPLSSEERENFTKLRHLRDRLRRRLHYINAGDSAETAAEKAESEHVERMARYQEQPEVEPAERKKRVYEKGPGVYHGSDSNGVLYRWAADKNKVFGTASKWGLVGESAHMLQYDDATMKYIGHKKRMDALKREMWDEDLSEAELREKQNLHTKMMQEGEELFNKAPFHIDFETHFNTVNRLMGILRDSSKDEETKNDAALQLNLMPPLSRVLVQHQDEKTGKMKYSYLVYPRIDGATPAEVLGFDYVSDLMGENYTKHVDWSGKLKELQTQAQLHGRLSEMLEPILDVMSRSGRSSDDIANMTAEEFTSALDELGVTDRYGAPVLGVTDRGGYPLMSKIQITSPTREFIDQYKVYRDVLNNEKSTEQEKENAQEQMDSMMSEYQEGGVTEERIGVSYHPNLGFAKNPVDNLLEELGYRFTDREGSGMQAYHLEQYGEPSALSDLCHVQAHPMDFNEIESETGSFTPHKLMMAIASAALYGETAELPGSYDRDGGWSNFSYAPSAGDGGTLDKLKERTKVEFNKIVQEMAKWQPNTLLSLMRHGALTHLAGNPEVRNNLERMVSNTHFNLDLGGARTDRDRWQEAIPLNDAHEVKEAIRDHARHAKMINDILEEVNTLKESKERYRSSIDQLIGSDADQERITATQDALDAVNEQLRTHNDELRALKGDKALDLPSDIDPGVEFLWEDDNPWTVSGDNLVKNVRFVEGGWESEDQRMAEQASLDEPEGMVPRYYQETYTDPNGHTRVRLVPNTNFDDEVRMLSEAIEGVGSTGLGSLPFTPEWFDRFPVSQAEESPRGGSYMRYPSGLVSSDQPTAPSNVYSTTGIGPSTVVPQEEWLDPVHGVDTRPPLPTVGSMVTRDGEERKYTEEDRLQDLRNAIKRGHGTTKFAGDGDDIEPAPHQIASGYRVRQGGQYLTGGFMAPQQGYFHPDSIRARLPAQTEEGQAGDDVIEMSWKTGDPLEDAMRILKILS